MEGNSTKTIPRKIHRHPIIAEIESCSFATRTPVKAAKTGSIAKIIATLVGDVCFCADVWMKKAMDVANREVRNSANKKEEFVHSATENNFSQSSNKKAQIEENSPTANTCDVLNNKGDIFLEKKPLIRI